MPGPLEDQGPGPSRAPLDGTVGELGADAPVVATVEVEEGAGAQAAGGRLSPGQGGVLLRRSWS